MRWDRGRGWPGGWRGRRLPRPRALWGMEAIALEPWCEPCAAGVSVGVSTACACVPRSVVSS